jgi:hypothetical protein
MTLGREQSGFGACMARPDASSSTPSAEDKQNEVLNNVKLVGKHDGKIEGVRYFRCPDRTGLFVRPSKLRVILT